MRNIVPSAMGLIHPVEGLDGAMWWTISEFPSCLIWDTQLLGPSWGHPSPPPKKKTPLNSDCDLCHWISLVFRPGAQSGQTMPLASMIPACTDEESSWLLLFCEPIPVINLPLLFPSVFIIHTHTHTISLEISRDI